MDGVGEERAKRTGWGMGERGIRARLSSFHKRGLLFVARMAGLV
jgi:hypothetical protein